MGIEALSRGARHVTFVDNDWSAVEAIRSNLEVTDLTAKATVIRADAMRFDTGTAAGFDLAIVDPPYAFDDWDALARAAARAGRRHRERP